LDSRESSNETLDAIKGVNYTNKSTDLSNHLFLF